MLRNMMKSPKWTLPVAACLALFLGAAAVSASQVAWAGSAEWAALIERGAEARRAGDGVAAERAWQASLSAAGSAPSDCRAESLNRLKEYYDGQGRVGEAAAALEAYLAVRRVLVGSDTAQLADDLYGAAGFYIGHREIARGTPFLEEVLVIDREVFGPAHPLVGDGLLYLAVLYDEIDELAAARRSYEGALTVYEQIFPADHADLGLALDRYAGLLVRLGETERAAEFAARAAATQYERPGND